MEPNPAEVPVVILCGGQGTRIREASEKLPKPLINIGAQPILWHIMNLYSHHGFKKFVLCLGFKASDIKQYFLEYNEMVSDLTINLADGSRKALSESVVNDWEVSLIDTGIPTGTGGRLAKVAPYLDHDYFMLTYGDGIADIDLKAELSMLSNSDKLGLVAGIHPSGRYGELEVQDNTVTGFAEKLPSDGWVSGGFFAFRKQFLDYVPKDEPEHFFEHDPIKKLTSEGNLGFFPHEGFWMGMDTYREYSALNEMWRADKAPWKLW